MESSQRHELTMARRREAEADEAEAQAEQALSEAEGRLETLADQRVTAGR